MRAAFSHAVDQAYFLALALINGVHRWLPFFMRPWLYRLCGYQVHPSATVQGGVRFFHVGRLEVGEGTLVNRGVYLDNRGGIILGRHVSIAHDARLYTMGHDPHDPTFATKSSPIRIGDHAVVFAGAMLMPGVQVGAGAVVMAGSVVTRDVPAGRMVGGNPAVDLGERQCTPAYRLKRRFWFAH